MEARAEKNRQPGQGGIAEAQKRDLRAQLLQAEAVHFSKTLGAANGEDATADGLTNTKRQLETTHDAEIQEEEDANAKRRRVLEETRDIDADSDGSEDESSEEERWCLRS